MNNLKGYIAINEQNKVSYIPEGNSVELTILRVLEGKKFDIIDLYEIDENLIRHLAKL